MDLAQILVSLVVFAVVIFAGAYIIPGISVKSPMTALIVAIAFAILNILLGGVLTWFITFITMPVVLITFGLFTFFIPMIVNAFLLMIAEHFIADFEVEGIIQPFLLAILIGAAYYALNYFYV